jgi:hypothetical protein
MSYEIQPGIDCENCIKCGTRPVIDEAKKGGWEVKCPNEACKNVVASPLVDIETWNRLNKKNVNLSRGDNSLMRSA